MADSTEQAIARLKVWLQLTYDRGQSDADEDVKALRSAMQALAQTAGLRTRLAQLEAERGASVALNGRQTVKLTELGEDNAALFNAKQQAESVVKLAQEWKRADMRLHQLSPSTQIFMAAHVRLGEAKAALFAALPDAEQESS